MFEGIDIHVHYYRSALCNSQCADAIHSVELQYKVEMQRRKKERSFNEKEMYIQYLLQK